MNQNTAESLRVSEKNLSAKELRVAELVGQVVDLTETIKSKDETISGKTAEIVRIGGELDNARSSLRTMTRNLEDVTRVKSELEAQTKSQNERILALESVIQDKNRERHSDQNEIAELRGKLRQIADISAIREVAQGVPVDEGRTATTTVSDRTTSNLARQQWREGNSLVKLVA